jgi:hypothetical protein
MCAYDATVVSAGNTPVLVVATGTCEGASSVVREWVPAASSGCCGCWDAAHMVSAHKRRGGATTPVTHHLLLVQCDHHGWPRVLRNLHMSGTVACTP